MAADPFAACGSGPPVGRVRGNDERDEDLTPETMSGGVATSDWRAFFRRHSGAVALFAVAVVAAVSWAVYVFWWFTGNAQSTGLVPSALGSWTMGNLISFCVYSVFWELLLVGVPAAVAAIGAWMWWKRLPFDEKAGYRWGKRSRAAGGSGWVGLLLFIAFALKVYFDGNWDAPMSTFTLNYVVGSMITILEWVAVIFGIPLAIGLAWWVRREMRKA